MQSPLAIVADMIKDLNQWNKEKERLDRGIAFALFREREVWWCSLGANIGHEQNGSSSRFTRPVVIITKFNLDVCLIAPLTTSNRTGKYYFPLGSITGRPSSALLSQIRLVDRKRLITKITTLPEPVFNQLTLHMARTCFPHLGL